MKIDPKGIRPGDRIRWTTEWEVTRVEADLILAAPHDRGKNRGQDGWWFLPTDLAHAEITRPYTLKPGDRVRCRYAVDPVIGRYVGELDGNAYVLWPGDSEPLRCRPSDLIPAEGGPGGSDD
jgi:hypothetical protein